MNEYRYKQRERLKKGELWWGGLIDHGVHMPFGEAPYMADLRRHATGNQAAPLLVSNRGRYIVGLRPFRFAVDGRELILESDEPLRISDAYGSGGLREAVVGAAGALTSKAGRMPDPRLFASPQYNLWIEMKFEPTQAKVLAYAEEALRQGFPPGVLTIDDNWQEYYGSHTFHAGRFPDPRRMTERLNELGFPVMLWVSPFVSPDSVVFRSLRDRKLLVASRDGSPYIAAWWNGYSAMIDFTKPEAAEWFHTELDGVQKSYGVNGFKFDGGDMHFYPEDGYRHCEAWARIGAEYALNEYRACWDMRGAPLAQRQRDKRHAWGRDGLASLIPNGLAMSLMGYVYHCPDMIGGGEIDSFTDTGFRLDEELFVRYAECAALFPMMQFSLAPWKALSGEALAHCREAVRLRSRHAEMIVELARHAAATGEPIMRPLAYEYPDMGCERVDDQFMVGNRLLVAPVLKQGAVSRLVDLPPGIWRDAGGGVTEGPAVVQVSAPLGKLPLFELVEGGVS